MAHISDHQADLFGGNGAGKRLAQRFQPLHAQAGRCLLDQAMRFLADPLRPVFEPSLLHQVRYHADHRRDLAIADSGDLLERLAFGEKTQRFLGGTGCDYRRRRRAPAAAEGLQRSEDFGSVDFRLLLADTRNAQELAQISGILADQVFE